MAKKTSDKIDELLNAMSESDVSRTFALIRMEIGDRQFLKILENVTSKKRDFDPEDVARRAANCTEMDEREWYRVADDDGFGGYIHPSENACEYIQNNIREEFEKELKQIVSTGDTEAASRFLVAIAEGLKESSGILADECPDFPIEFADELEKHAIEKNFKDVFRW